jgi:hypothetical protein
MKEWMNYVANVCMYLCGMYVCMYVCMHACMYVCMYACMYICMCVCMCLHVHMVWILILLYIHIINYTLSNFNKYTCARTIKIFHEQALSNKHEVIHNKTETGTLENAARNKDKGIWKLSRHRQSNKQKHRPKGRHNRVEQNVISLLPYFVRLYFYR